MISFRLKNSFLLVVCLTLLVSAAAQTKQEKQAAKEAMIRNLVDKKEYVFIATTMIPTGGRSRQLTSTYDIKVFGDTVITELPYFGRVYTATPGSASDGINFTSTKYDYHVTPAKKGGWDIEIKPKDGNEVREVSLSISASGYTTVYIISNSRQSISYYGYLEERKEK